MVVKFCILSFDPKETLRRANGSQNLKGLGDFVVIFDNCKLCVFRTEHLSTFRFLDGKYSSTGQVLKLGGDVMLLEGRCPSWKSVLQSWKCCPGRLTWSADQTMCRTNSAEDQTHGTVWRSASESTQSRRFWDSWVSLWCWNPDHWDWVDARSAQGTSEMWPRSPKCDLHKYVRCCMSKEIMNSPIISAVQWPKMELCRSSNKRAIAQNQSAEEIVPHCIDGELDRKDFMKTFLTQKAESKGLMLTFSATTTKKSRGNEAYEPKKYSLLVDLPVSKYKESKSSDYIWSSKNATTTKKGNLKASKHGGFIHQVGFSHSKFLSSLCTSHFFSPCVYVWERAKTFLLFCVVALPVLDRPEVLFCRSGIGKYRRKGRNSLRRSRIH